ncbi:P-loop containing nucleoside triphosphate hydrolase protein [Mycena olivaceomarginata]|nr:P-loop containing nucleoside triphosphate hydrolase protein [Mycena olivaceomarginata]
MKEKTDKLDDYSVTAVQLGIWRVLVPIQAATGKLSFLHSWLRKWNGFKSSLPVVIRFLREIYSLDPGLNMIYFLVRLGTSVEGTLLLYASSRLLQTVEIGLTSGRPDVNAILQAVVLRIMCTVLTSVIRWASMRVTPEFQSRMTSHFDEHVLRARLRLDLPTSADKNNELGVSSVMMWYHFQDLTGLFERVFNLTSQLIFTAQQPKGGITLTVDCARYVVYASNRDYLRARALRWLSGEEYREDIISGDIVDWILAEYKKARDALGKTSESHPETQFLAQNTPVTDIAMQLSNDLPTFYWAASVILNPRSFSIASFAILQQHANALRGSIFGLYHEFSTISDVVLAIRNLYKIADLRNKIVDGDEAYPNSASTDKGMTFELKNVSFAYPGGKSKENAIRNVSLKIPAGHLVVIVGENGSGKSTIIKLLNRLYDVDSGEILVDGIPIKNYRLPDLRKVQAMLSQDHALYPLSLAENIGLGNPDCVNDMKMILEAATAGGASEVIKKLNDGVETVDQHENLQKILADLEQRAEVSGGEKQRLVAARTFMRFLSGNIRFAVADEPSSALDPKAEHQLFQRLRESGDGKTLIFVTHRFGHLTKHADLIICMKDGQAVETGTHKELMALKGEYSELYNVQAQAFSEDSL